MDKGVIWAVLIAYLLVLLAVAAWSVREGRSMRGYFLAGKKLPFWVVAFSTNATGESGWLLLGLSGMAYAVGLHALWIVLGEVIGIALSWMLIARRLKVDTDRLDSITVPDYLATKFDDRRNSIRKVSVPIILLMVVVYAAAQLVAAGKSFEVFLSLDYRAGVLLGAVVTVAYTAVGGFKAVAYTDALQGVLMLGALVLLPVAGFVALGGSAGFLERLAAADPSLVDLLGPQGYSIAGLVAVLSFLAIGLPFLGVPQLLTRFMSIRSEREVRAAGMWSVGVILLFDLGAVLIGLTGRLLFPELPDPETVLPHMSQELLPPLLAGLVMVVVIAAIMSTVDSLLILASSAIVKDFLADTLRKRWASERIARVGKSVTLLVGVSATVIALGDSRAIFWFVMFAWSGLGAAFGPVVLCSLYRKDVTREGVVAGISGGFLTIVLWVLFVKPLAFDLFEMVPAFIVSLLLCITVSRWSAVRAVSPEGAAVKGTTVPAVALEDGSTVKRRGQ